MATKPLDDIQYVEIMRAIKNGGIQYETPEGIRTTKGNDKVFLALFIQANTGLRIGDILESSLDNFSTGKLSLDESKTGKQQTRDINPAVVNMILLYANEKGIKGKDKLFERLSVRAVQKHLKIITDSLKYNDISTHSFRKYYATTQYKINSNNILLVKELLNHSTVAVTQKYIGIKSEEINNASRNHITPEII